MPGKRLRPELIELDKKQNGSGSLSFIEDDNLPFRIARLYWLYDMEENAQRGGHCHPNSDRLIICMSGNAEIQLTGPDLTLYNYTLHDPSTILFFPRNHWIEMSCSQDARLMIAASVKYQDDVYIRDYTEFCEMAQS